MAERSAATDGRTTLSELLRLPDHEGRVELVRGRLVREPPPTPLHGRLQAHLARWLDAWADEHELGAVLTEAGFVLSRDPDTVRAPDLAFVSAGRIPAAGYGAGYWEMAPDLAVEVVSPSNRASAIQAKVLDWLDAGAREVWVVDPGAGTVAVHQPGGRTTVLRRGDLVEGGDLLPGFTLALDRLFTVAIGGPPPGERP